MKQAELFTSLLPAPQAVAAVGIVAFLALSAVPAFAQGNVSQVDRVRIVAPVTELLRCGAALKFSGPPRPFMKAEFAKFAAGPQFRNSMTWEIDVLLYVSSKINESAMCICRDRQFGDSDMTDSERDLRAMPKSRFLQTSSTERSRRTLIADIPTSSGTHPLARMILVFPTANKFCMATAQVLHDGSLSNEAKAFLEVFADSYESESRAPK